MVGADGGLWAVFGYLGEDGGLGGELELQSDLRKSVVRLLTCIRNVGLTRTLEVIWLRKRYRLCILIGVRNVNWRIVRPC